MHIETFLNLVVLLDTRHKDNKEIKNNTVLLLKLEPMEGADNSLQCWG